MSAAAVTTGREAKGAAARLQAVTINSALRRDRSLPEHTGNHSIKVAFCDLKKACLLVGKTLASVYQR